MSRRSPGGAPSGAYANASQTGQIVGPNNGSNVQSTQYQLRQAQKKLEAMATGTAQFRHLTYGSSVAAMKIRETAGLVSSVFGGQNGAIIDSGSTGTYDSYGGVTQNATAGAWTDNTTDFAAWPSGLTSVLGAGASRTFGVGGAAITCDHIEVYYVGGTGVFSVQVDSGAAVNVDTSLTAAGTLGIYTVTPALGSHSVTIALVSGTPKILTNGVGMWNSTLNGWTPVAVAQGGINLFAATAQAFTNLTTFLAHVAPDLITFEMKSGQIDSSFGAGGNASGSLPAFQSWLTAIANAYTADAGPDVLVIGSTPDSSSSGTTAGGLQQQCNQKCAALCQGMQPGLNAFMWDGYTPLVNWALVNAEGWGADGTHLAGQAQALLAMLMWRDVGLFGLRGGSFPLPVRNAATQTAELDIGPAVQTSGNASNAWNLKVKAAPSSSTDTQFQIGRQLNYFDQAGNQFVQFDSRNNAGNPSWLPVATQIGNGFAGFVGVNHSYLPVRDGTNMNNPAGIQAILLPYSNDQSLSANGAVTFNSSLGSVQRVALSANATSSSITNVISDGQMLTIEWVQDATGGRTYSWPGNCRFAAGVAPSDTTAGTATSVSFMYDSTATRWLEKARAVAVPTT